MGVFVAGLRTTLFPAAMAGATARIERFRGKFHGEMTVTTPFGCRSTMFSLLGMFESACSPFIRRGSVAASLVWSLARWTDVPPMIAEPPASRPSRPTISSSCSSRRWKTFCSTSCRRAGGACAHSVWASAAASYARFTSASVPSGTSATTSRVDGSSTAMVSPLSAGTHSPSMYCALQSASIESSSDIV